MANKKINFENLSGDRENALKYLNEMLGRSIKPTTVTQTAILSAHALIDPDKAKELLDQMKSKMRIEDGGPYDTIIHGYVKQGKFDQALAVLREMEADKIQPSSYSYAPLIRACCHLPDGADKALAFVAEMRKKDIALNAVLYSHLIIALVMHKRPVADVIDEMAARASYPRLDTFEYLIKTLATHHDKDNVVRVWRHLLKSGLVINDEIFDEMMAVARGERNAKSSQNKLIDDELLEEVEKVKRQTHEERDAKIRRDMVWEAKKKQREEAREREKETMISEAWERKIKQEVEDQRNAYKEWRRAFEKWIIHPAREDERHRDLKKERLEKGLPWPPPEPPRAKADEKRAAQLEKIEQRKRKMAEAAAEMARLKALKIAQQDQELLGKMSKQDRALYLAAKEEEDRAAAKRARGKDADDEDEPVVSTKKEKKEEEGPKGKKKKKKAETEAPEKAAGGGGAGGGGKAKK